jgi:spoIIIJ-associated protein
VGLALAELGVGRNDVDVEVLDEGSKGIFGLLRSRPARIKVTVRENPIERVETFLTGLCERMGAPATVTVRSENSEEIVLSLETPNGGLLIGKRGQSLDAMQYLASVIYGRTTGPDQRRRLVLDVGDYRARRAQTLERLAVNMASKVKRTRQKVVLEPMDPYERRIIHMALQNDQAVYTYSEGDEPNRKVIIALKNAKSE